MAKKKPLKIIYKYTPDKEAEERAVKFLNEKMLEQVGKKKKPKVEVVFCEEEVDFVKFVEDVLKFRKQ